MPQTGARKPAAQTNINAILDALASLGIAHIHIADPAQARHAPADGFDNCTTGSSALLSQG